MAAQKVIRCAVYTRKSTEHNLDLEFNSLDAQREFCEAYIKSQLHEGWRLLADHYDDGGFSGGSLDRPELVRLLGDIQAGKVDTVVVYKVDRLTRSLTDFAKLVELFDVHGVSFVSVTQAFNTTNSMWTQCRANPAQGHLSHNREKTQINRERTGHMPWLALVRSMIDQTLRQRVGAPRSPKSSEILMRLFR